MAQAPDGWWEREGVRREVCTRGERWTQQALPEVVAGSDLCLEPVAKWKGAVLFLSSYSACCYPELTLAVCAVWTRGQQQISHQMVSNSSVSAWEMVSKSSWLWPGHLPHRTSLRDSPLSPFPPSVAACTTLLGKAFCKWVYWTSTVEVIICFSGFQGPSLVLVFWDFMSKCMFPKYSLTYTYCSFIPHPPLCGPQSLHHQSGFHNRGWPWPPSLVCSSLFYPSFLDL